MKRRLEKKPPVTEAAFETMIEQQDDVSEVQDHAVRAQHLCSRVKQNDIHTPGCAQHRATGVISSYLIRGCVACHHAISPGLQPTVCAMQLSEQQLCG